MIATKKEDLIRRITTNPKMMTGKPTIRGFRIPVEQILSALANGVTVSELLDEYPELEPEDIQAALLHATELVSEERVYAVT